MKKKLTFLSLLCLFLLCFSSLLLLNACSDSKSGPDWQVQEDFGTFLDELFVNEVSQDALTLHYLVANPEEFGITSWTADFGTYSAQDRALALARVENYQQKLAAFSYDSLDSENRLIYDMLNRVFTQELAMSEYVYYEEVLGPTCGVQAQLPILLAEYTFYDRKDIRNYLVLLDSVDDYFVQIEAFEKEKSAAGFFMSDETADAIIEQCLSFVQNPEEHYLLACFAERLESLTGLTEEEKKEFLAQNQEIVENSVIPAYEHLASVLSSLKGTGQNDGGLCGYENGRDYYQLLLQSSTGSSRSIPEMQTLLTSALTNNLRLLARIVSDYPDIYEQYETMQFPETEPSESLTYLQEAIRTEFPSLSGADCEIRYIHESLQDYLSPAMYLVPPIDDYNRNYIYINASPSYDLSSLFPTIAHEGYPGHLYQTVYFRASDPEPIRSLLDVTGYSEGWATYAELYSYDLAGISDELASFLQANVLATHCLYSLTDIGIHYNGWDLSDTAEFLGEYGFDTDTARRIFFTMVAEPGMYLPYSIGCLEILELRQTAKDTLGEEFSLLAFHTFLLDFGPAPFDLIERGMTDWMDSVRQAKARK